MDSSGSSPTVTPEDVWGVFARRERPCAPVTAGEVAEDLHCPRKAAQERLAELAERGDVETREVEGGTRVWWRSKGTPTIDQWSTREAFTALVEAVEDCAVFALDSDGVVLDWNEGAERIEGYEEDDIVGEHFSTFYTDTDVDAGVPERSLETAATGGSFEDEGWRVRGDGSRFWASVTITAVRDDSGALQGFTKVTRDMTERQEYERRLSRERDLTEQVLQTVPVSIFVSTSDGKLVRANQRLLDRLDLNQSEIGDYSVDSWEIYDAEGEPIPVDEWPWKRVTETGEPVYDYECQVHLPDTGRRWLSLNAVPMDCGRDDDWIVFSIDDITDQKQHEQQLRREYDLTEKLLRIAPIAIVVQDAEGETVMANERAQEILGLSEREFIEEPENVSEWQICDANGEPLAPSETPAARVLRTGEPILNEELVVKLPDDRRLQLDVNVAPLFGPDGTIERTIITGEDITELKAQERQLKRRKAELETELSDILGRISNAFYALDEEWRFTHLNEQAATVMGHAKDELLNRNIWDVFPDAEGGIYWERLHTAMETQEPVSFEVYAERRGAWLEFSAYPSESGLSIYFHDITERVERERKLEESEQRYRTLIEHFPNGAVALVDGDLRYQTVGGRPLEAVDAPAEALSGASVREIIPSRIADEIVPRYEAALTGESSTVEMDIGGQTYQFRFVPVRDDTGDVFAALGMSQDITERREYEHKLEESNERLEQFAYATSHDLQEPLRMVSTYLQLIEQRYVDFLDEDGEEFLRFAIDGADRMRSMIQGLLHYSRVETQGDEFEPVDLGTVLEDVRENLRVKLDEHGAEITAEPLPRVEGDENQLRQVFQNLLSNAIEYSGDEPPRVHISAERDGPVWTVSVTDEGIGVSRNDRERIFEVFQRGHGGREHSGTGIGLALCERIVERHDGDIWVESTPGEGATFSFTLPAVHERPDE